MTACPGADRDPCKGQVSTQGSPVTYVPPATSTAHTHGAGTSGYKARPLLSAAGTCAVHTQGCPGQHSPKGQATCTLPCTTQPAVSEAGTDTPRLLALPWRWHSFTV